MKEANIIFSSLNEVGKEAQVKFVGGCVRKSLCGEKIEDIDLATSITPDEVKKKLSDKPEEDKKSILKNQQKMKLSKF